LTSVDDNGLIIVWMTRKDQWVNINNSKKIDELRFETVLHCFQARRDDK